MTRRKNDSCKLAFECAKKWDSLTATNQEGVRHCSSCDESVHWCNTQEDIERAKKKGWCVAYKGSYKNNKQVDEIATTVGVLASPPYEISKK